MSGAVNSLADYDVFQPRFITKVINDLIIDPVTYGAIDKYIPSRDQAPNLGTDIEWDEDVFLGGMTKPSDVNSSSPQIAGDGGSTHKWTPPHFREKTVIGGSHILNMRKLGSNNQMRTLSEQVIKWIKYLRTRVDNRIYWMKWEAVQNSAPFTVVSNNVNYSFDYSSVGYHPTPAIPWNGVGPTIIDDIIGFIAQFRNASTRPTDAYFGSTVLQAMIADPTIRTLISAQIGNAVNPKNIFNITPGQNGVATFFEQLFAGVKFNYYSSGPVVAVSTITPNPGGVVTATPVDGPVELFAVSDECVLKTPGGARTNVLVSAVSEAAGTITITTTGGAAIAQPRGSVIRKKMEFMHPDRFVMFSEMPPGQLGGDVAAEFVTVANFHGDGGIENMQSGIVGKSINKELEDPPRIELVSSFTGGIVVYHGDGPWLAAKVL